MAHFNLFKYSTPAEASMSQSITVIDSGGADFQDSTPRPKTGSGTRLRNSSVTTWELTEKRLLGLLPRTLRLWITHICETGLLKNLCSMNFGEIRDTA